MYDNIGVVIGILFICCLYYCVAKYCYEIGVGETLNRVPVRNYDDETVSIYKKIEVDLKRENAKRTLKNSAILFCVLLFLCFILGFFNWNTDDGNEISPNDEQYDEIYYEGFESGVLTALTSAIEPEDITYEYINNMTACDVLEELTDACLAWENGEAHEEYEKFSDLLADTLIYNQTKKIDYKEYQEKIKEIPWLLYY